MNKSVLFFILLAGFTLQSQAQSGLYILPGTSLFINANNIVSVDGMAMQPSSAFAISGSNSLVRNTVISHSSTSNYISRVFKFSNTVNAFSGNITIYYNDAELNGIPEPALTLNIHNGSKWSDYLSGVTRDGIANFVQTSGIGSVDLNELTLASLSSPLPLKWGPVTAYRKNGLAYIEWQTYDELNTSYFEVESSMGGNLWHRVSNPVVAFNTSGNHAYKLPDSSVTAAATYYRVRQVDQDNKSSYSPVVMITAINEQSALMVYPNPAKDQLTLRANNGSIVLAALYEAGGQLLRTEKINSTIGQLDLTQLPAGFYMLRALLSNGTTETHQFIKK